MHISSNTLCSNCKHNSICKYSEDMKNFMSKIIPIDIDTTSLNNICSIEVKCIYYDGIYYCTPYNLTTAGTAITAERVLNNETAPADNIAGTSPTINVPDYNTLDCINKIRKYIDSNGSLKG